MVQTKQKCFMQFPKSIDTISERCRSKTEKNKEIKTFTIVLEKKQPN